MSVFTRFAEAQVAAAAIPPYAGTIQDWMDDLDAMGAEATADDLMAHLVCRPEGVDSDLVSMVLDSIAEKREQPAGKPQHPHYVSELADNDNDGLPTP